MTDRAARPAGPPAAAVRGRKDGFGRANSPAAESTSDALRRGSGALLRRRRKGVGLALAAATSLGIVALYQTGLIRHLPDPPLGPWDSDSVDATGPAYQFLTTPDALLGLGSYAATAALIAMGDGDRAQRQAWIPLLAAAKVSGDALGAAALTVEQWSTHRKLCFWCTAAAAATFAMVPQVLPEARVALRTVRGGR